MNELVKWIFIVIALIFGFGSEYTYRRWYEDKNWKFKWIFKILNPVLIIFILGILSLCFVEAL